jgi:penicillin-binding protein 1C
VSPDASVSFCESCAPATGFIKKLYPVTAPDMEQFLVDNGRNYQKIPPHNPSCEKIFRETGPVISSPTNETEYYVNRKDPEPIQLKAMTGNDVSRVWWYIDDQFYKSGGAGEALFFVPKEGSVKISCTDDKGRNRNIRIQVRYINL